MNLKCVNDWKSTNAFCGSWKGTTSKDWTRIGAMNPSNGGARLRRALEYGPTEQSGFDGVSPHPSSWVGATPRLARLETKKQGRAAFSGTNRDSRAARPCHQRFVERQKRARANATQSSSAPQRIRRSETLPDRGSWNVRKRSIEKKESTCPSAFCFNRPRSA